MDPNVYGVSGVQTFFHARTEPVDRDDDDENSIFAASDMHLGRALPIVRPFSHLRRSDGPSEDLGIMPCSDAEADSGRGGGDSVRELTLTDGVLHDARTWGFRKLDLSPPSATW